MFYQTLVLTPMLLLSGVFFPLAQLPQGIRRAAMVLPLAHAVELIRAAMLGRPIGDVVVHLCVLAAYAVVPFFVCAALFRRRLMR
jgi:lipooligosaccharide transport system permease protein